MYKKIELSFDKIPHFSGRDVAYQLGDPSLSDFYKYQPEIQSFANAIVNRKSFKTNRDILVKTLMAQYKGINNSENALKNIGRLADANTFTVVTAHQPSLLTGPLYYIYKICSAISLTRQLNAQDKEHHIVPVFIMGGEDHDFEEISTAHLFNKSFSWYTDQKGAVGRMTTDGLADTITQVIETFGQAEFAENLTSIFKESLDLSKSYGEFAFRLTHSLFKEHELVIVNMDQLEFKQLFLPYVIDDIAHNISHSAVLTDQMALEQAGFKSQAHVREVNIFIHGEDRDRVINNNDGSYTIGEQNYSSQEFGSLLQERTGDISPNVILRPLFQEVVLPNLAYIGGGGELAYWMERTTLFDKMKVPFPILIRRDSVLIIDKKSASVLYQEHISVEQLFNREEQIVKLLTLNDSDVNIDLSFVKNLINQAFSQVVEITKNVDSTLENSVLAEESKSIKSIEFIESKLLKAEKKKKETEINKISRIKQKHFPNNDSLQERYDNFIPYYLKYGDKWIEELINQLDPVNKNMKILIEE